MTPEEQQLVESVGDAIRATPRPWNDLTPQEQAVLQAALMPGSDGFTSEQRTYLHRWWLQGVEGTEETLNSLIPPPANTVVTPRLDVNGVKYFGADLLSDALQGGPMAHTLDTLKTLVLRYQPEWPADPDSLLDP